MDRPATGTLTSLASVAVGLAAWQAASLWLDVGVLFPTFTRTAAKVFLIAYTTIFIVLVNTMVGVTHVATNRLRMARSFGAGAVQVFALIVLPSTVPFILTGMRIAMGNSIATIVAAILDCLVSGEESG